MFLSAFACMNADPASRTYYDKQRARGKTHTQALLRRRRPVPGFLPSRDGRQLLVTSSSSSCSNRLLSPRKLFTEASSLR